MMTQFVRGRIIRSALAVLLAAALVGCAAKPTPEQTASADSAKRLSRQEVEATVIGNTISGVTEKGDAFSEYYAADGSIRGVSDGEKYPGKWRFDGDELCGDYADGDEHDWCAKIAVNGDQLYWLNADGSVYNAARPARIDSGNPNSL